MDSSVALLWVVVLVLAGIVFLDVLGVMELLGGEGPQGEKGDPGPQGEPGPPGSEGFGIPDYDSGWRDIDPGDDVFLDHELSTTNLLVYLVGKSKLGQFVNQMGIGTTDGTQAGSTGAFWILPDEDTIRVVRAATDMGFEQFRVAIWKIPARVRTL